MAHDPKVLVERLREVADALPYEIETKPMMGGFVGYADGRPFVSLSPGGFGVKLLPADQEQLLARPGAERMRHSPEEPASKTYITLSPADLADDEILLHWLTIAAQTAPPRKTRRR